MFQLSLTMRRISWIHFLLSDYVLDTCVTLLCIAHWKGFHLHSTCTSIMIPSGITQYEVHQQGHIQGLSFSHIPPLIWIKILEASWLTAFNHFDVALKRTSLLMYAHWSSADAQDFIRLLVSVGGCIQVWASLTDVVHAGQIFMHIRITYHRKRAFLSLCSFPSNSQPHTRMCRRPPAGNMGFPKRHWLSSGPLSWRMARHLPSSSLWTEQGCKNRQNLFFSFQKSVTSYS